MLNFNVAWLLPKMGYGGDLLYIEPILRIYTGLIPNCRIYVRKGYKAEQQSNLPMEPALRSLFIRVPGLRKGAYPYVMVVPSPGVIRNVLDFRPEVLVLNEFGPVSLYGLVAAQLLHNCRVLLLVESDPGPSGSSIIGWRTRMRRFMARRADLVLTNNNAGREYLTKTLGIAEAKIMQAPYLTSEAGHQEAQGVRGLRTREGEGGCTFVYVGQLVERKALDLLVRAVAGLSAEHRKRCTVRLVGDGDQRCQLEALSRELGVADSIRFVGRVPYSELGSQYEASDVFVLPTRQDYRALVSFEALSEGMPLLISKYDGAAPETVDEAKNGFTFNPLDIPEFTGLLEWFLDNSHRLDDFRARSRQKAEAFTVEKAAENLVRATKRCREAPV